MAPIAAEPGPWLEPGQMEEQAGSCCVGEGTGPWSLAPPPTEWHAEAGPRSGGWSAWWCAVPGEGEGEAGLCEAADGSNWGTGYWT